MPTFDPFCLFVLSVLLMFCLVWHFWFFIRIFWSAAISAMLISAMSRAALQLFWVCPWWLYMQLTAHLCLHLLIFLLCQRTIVLFRLSQAAVSVWTWVGNVQWFLTLCNKVTSCCVPWNEHWYSLHATHLGSGMEGPFEWEVNMWPNQTHMLPSVPTINVQKMPSECYLFWKCTSATVNKHVQTTKAEKAHLIQVTLSVPNNSKSTAYQDSAAVPYLRPKLLVATFVVVRIVTSLVSTNDWFLVNLVIMSRACLGTSIGTWTNKKLVAASVHAETGSDTRHMETDWHLSKWGQYLHSVAISRCNVRCVCHLARSHTYSPAEWIKGTADRFSCIFWASSYHAACLSGDPTRDPEPFIEIDKQKTPRVEDTHAGKSIQHQETGCCID